MTPGGKGGPSSEAQPGIQGIGEVLQEVVPVLGGAGGAGDVSDPPEPDAVGKLHKRDFEQRGPADQREVIGWVFENFDIDDVDPAEAPSGGAWNMLQWARDDRKGFMGLWAKTFASKDEIKKQATDDGRKLFNLLDNLEQCAARAKGAQNG